MNKVSLLVATSAFALALTTGLGRAEEVPDAADMAKQSMEIKVDTVQEINAQIQATCHKYEKPGVMMFYAIEPVMVRPDNIDWVRYRSMAYDAAILSAQEQYLVAQGLKNISEIANSTFQVSGQDPIPYDDTELKKPRGLDQLVDKMVALGTGKIDQELVKLGIDPKDYEKQPEPQRHTTFKQALTKKATQRAFASLVGMVPVETFEGNDKDGNFNVGVCVVVSQKMKDFAANMIKSKGNLESVPEKAVDLTKLYKDPAQLFRQFGIRNVYDNTGSPAMISFYQWSSTYKGTDPAMKVKYDQQALQSARTYAKEQMFRFVNASGAYQNESSVESTIEDYYLQNPNNIPTTPETQKQLIERTLSNTSVKSSEFLTGIRDLYQWTGKHPVTGRDIVGIVVIWSAAYEREIRGLKDNRPAATAATPTPKATTPTEAGVKAAPALVTPDDF